MKKGPDDKHAILDRLYKQADSIYRRYTNRPLQRLGGLDPLIHMLLGACASEFEKISHEIHSSWSRSLARLAQLLIPDAQLNAQPSHGIIHARPFDDQSLTDPLENQIVCSRNKNQPFFFSPSGQFQVINSDVKYITFGNKIYENVFDTIPRIEQRLTGNTKNKIPPFNLWLGLEWTNTLAEIDHLNFFFDWPTTVLKQNSEKILNSSIWKINDEKYRFSLGLEDLSLRKQDIEIDYKTVLSKRIERAINEFYEDRFVSLKLQKPLTKEVTFTFPKSFKSIFDLKELNNLFKESMLWIKIEFSPVFFPPNVESDQIFDRLKCMLNCFPVINRKLEQKSFRLEEYFNLFPLETKGFFLSVEDVTNANLSVIYQANALSHNLDKEDIKEKTYIIRQQGVNRFDERNAFQQIEYLLSIIREESIVFSAIGNEVAERNLKEIQKALNDLQSKVSKAKLNHSNLESLNFIMFPPEKEKRETVIVRYWWTGGQIGNNIDSSQLLSMAGQTLWEQDSLKFLTTTIGGTNPLGPEGQLDILKSSLVVKDKIVTQKDIEFYCKEKLGDKLLNINIRKGAKLSEKPYEGLISVLKVIIDTSLHNEKEIQYWTRILNLDLNTKSSAILPIDVTIKEIK